MRGFREEDLDAWAAISADREVTRWVGDPDGLSREEAWRRMAYFLGHWELRGFGQWALIEQRHGRLVGRAGLLQPENWPGLEVGWLVGREHWGRGFAPEAGRASLDWARDSLGADHVISLIEDAQRALGARRREARDERRGPDADRGRQVRGAHLRDRFG